MPDFKGIQNYFSAKQGLEIGGPSIFFSKNGFMPIYPCAESIDCVDFSESTVWSNTRGDTRGITNEGRQLGNRYVLDAVDLTALNGKVYDFILSCNNIEHIANPLKALEQWISVLKDKGIIVIVAPRKEANFDHKRRIVEMSHLVEDFTSNISEADMTHLQEVLDLHDLSRDPPTGSREEFQARCLKNFENRCIHHHVYDLAVLVGMFDYFGLSTVRTVELERDYVVIGQK
jgi:SAM-dependent methyltransferase